MSLRQLPISPRQLNISPPWDCYLATETAYLAFLPTLWALRDDLLSRLSEIRLYFLLAPLPFHRRRRVPKDIISSRRDEIICHHSECRSEIASGYGQITRRQDEITYLVTVTYFVIMRWRFTILPWRDNNFAVARSPGDEFLSLHGEMKKILIHF